MKPREDETARQLVHMLFGTIFIAMFVLLGREPTLWGIATGFAVGGIATGLISRGIKLPFFTKMLCEVERECEKTVPGRAALVYFLGMILLLFFFQNPQIILAAMIPLVYGDGIATIAGTRFGKRKLAFNKTIEGSTGFFFASIIPMLLLLPAHIAVLGAAIATLAEIIPFEDNLTIPLLTALALTFLL